MLYPPRRPAMLSQVSPTRTPCHSLSSVKWPVALSQTYILRTCPFISRPHPSDGVKDSLPRWLKGRFPGTVEIGDTEEAVRHLERDGRVSHQASWSDGRVGPGVCICSESLTFKQLWIWSISEVWESKERFGIMKMWRWLACWSHWGLELALSTEEMSKGSRPGERRKDSEFTAGSSGCCRPAALMGTVLKTTEEGGLMRVLRKNKRLRIRDAGFRKQGLRMSKESGCC